MVYEPIEGSTTFQQQIDFAVTLIDKEGILFIHGYATAATCTPIRYSLLNGDYPLRKKKARV